jgi:Gti1/Pac2 family transcription factor
MRRWTDGKSWSASRVSGSFLTYREMEGKRGGNAFAPPVTTTSTPNRQRTPGSNSGSDLDMDGQDEEGYRYKADGLMKQSFSITTATQQKLHLISYYARSHPQAGQLMRPSNDPNLKHIRPAKGMYPESTVHEQQNVPVVTQSPMMARQYGTPPHGSPASGMMAYPPNYVVAGYHPYARPGQPPAQLLVSPYPHQGLPPPHDSPLRQVQYSAAPQQAPVQLTVFDRPPPALMENGLPPPPRRETSGQQLAPPPLSQYAANPSPRIAQSHLAAQQADRTPGSVTPSNPSPRLHNMGTPPQLREINLSRAETPSSQTVPGVAALLNGSPRPDSLDTRSDHSGSRAGSRSPGQRSLDAQDIPNEKLSLGEDRRHLNLLDRAFTSAFTA